MGRQRAKHREGPAGLNGGGRWIFTGPQGRLSSTYPLYLTLLTRKKLHIEVVMICSICLPCILGVFLHHEEGESKSNAMRTMFPSPISWDRRRLVLDLLVSAKTGQ